MNGGGDDGSGGGDGGSGSNEGGDSPLKGIQKKHDDRFFPVNSNENYAELITNFSPIALLSNYTVVRS